MEYGTSDFKKGLRVLLDGEPYVVIGSDFMKPGKGQAVYRLKCRGLLRERIVDLTFRSGDKVQAADVQERSLELSYKAGPKFVFMDMESYEQHEVETESMGDAPKYLLEGMKCVVVFWNGKVISVEPPRQVELVVEYAEPAVKGNTTSGVSKRATMETELEVMVPAFINTGDVLKVDTRTGDYVERVKKA
jgi:elongation factor P